RGYKHPVIRGAIERALGHGLVHVSNLYRTEPGERLAEELVARSFADRAFFCNSGAEANEAAFKFARKWSGKSEIVAFSGSFHGRLFATLAATDRPDYRKPVGPLVPGIRIIAREDWATVDHAVSASRTAAVVVEPVQGEGGVRPVDAEWLGFVRELCDSRGVAVIFDEVQCGLGRTGTLFAYEQAGVVPDILTLAKPLAGGLPMGAVLVTSAVAAALKPGDHATTFGGGPLVAGVALEVVRTIADPAFLADVRRKAERLGAHLARLAAVALREAVLADVTQLEALMAPYVQTGDLLPRSNYDLCRHIKEYVVAEASAGEVIGCGSLKVYSRELAELAALAVRADWQGTGVGGALLAALIAEARAHGLAEVLALTRKPAFFLKAGFVPAEREHFPL